MDENIEGLPAGSQALDQKVLPETIEQCLALSPQYLAARDFFGRKLKKELKARQWTALEIRNTDLPDLNIYHTKAELSAEALEPIFAKLRKVISILGYAKEELPFFSILLDPSTVSYQAAGAFANVSERMIWVKDKGLSLPHEFTHIITLFMSYPDSDVLVEGISAFVEWESKTEEEKAADYADNYQIIARQFIKEPAIAAKIDTQGLDVQFDDDELMAAKMFGGLLFHTLCQDFSLTSQEIGKHWKTTSQFNSVSEWLESIGLDSKEVELAWKRRMAGKDVEQNPQNQISLLRFFIDTWKARLGIS